MDSQTLKQKAEDFLRLAAFGQPSEAFAKYVAPNFKHHNAYFKGNRQTLMKAMEEAHKTSPNNAFEIQRSVEEGNIVAVHSRVVKEKMEIAVVHIFRFESGKIAELWDVGQEVPKDGPNENGLF